MLGFSFLVINSCIVIDSPVSRGGFGSRSCKFWAVVPEFDPLTSDGLFSPSGCRTRCASFLLVGRGYVK